MLLWTRAVFNPKILAALSAGAAAVLALSTIFGGLWASGTSSTILILSVGAMIAAIKLWFASDNTEPDHLGWTGFRQTTPLWLRETDRHILEMLGRASLALLEFERTRSGCWSKTYLYRRSVSGSGIPLAGGSLTGTPLALLSVGASTMLPMNLLQKWAFEHLNVTFARTLGDDGQYITGYRIGQTGQVALREPLRHVAGAFLATLLRGGA